MGRSSVFSLEQIYRKQLTQTWSKIPEVFRYVNSLTSGTPNYGYFGAGAYNPRPEGPIVDRVDFDNDTATATPRSNLSSARYKCAGIGNKDYGYFGGGVTTSPSYDTTITTVDRLDYSNDSADMVAKGPLANHHRANDNTVGNNNYGYWCGSVGKSYVDRIDYSSDTSTTVEKGPLSIKRAGAMGAGDASYGYICGGETPSRVSSIDRIDFSSDTSTAAPKGNLTNTVDNGAATGNASYGYIGGGSTPSPVSTVDRIDYSNDTATASPKGPLVRTNWLFSATGNTSYGYFGGGDPPSSPSPSGSSFVDRVDYSNDTPTASPKGNLSLAYRNTNSFSPREYALPFELGIVPATRSEATGTGSYAHGYWIGGDGGGSRYHRVDFSNDTGTAGVRGNMDKSRSRHAAVSSMNYAYAAGGGTNTTIGRIDYADDTATSLVKGNLISSPYYSSPAGVDNKDYGYICGGLPHSIVQRIDYTNDTATASPKGPLTANRRYISASGNQSYGYVAGGTPAPGYMSSVDRIDYSNDSATALSKGNLSYVVIGHGMTGDADYGYVNGGFNAVPGSNNWISSTNRIDYANDTATASPKGPLTQARRNKSTGSTSYGWSGGGSTTDHAGTSTIDRIDFSNDTATASVRGPLSGTRTNLYTASAQANAKPQLNPAAPKSPQTIDKGADGYTQDSFGPAFGYHIGGMIPAGGGTNTSTVERIDFSNDTATAAVKGPLSSNRHSCATVGTSSFGYACGGPSPSDTSTVDRVDYANDTAAMTVVGPLNTPSSYNSAVYGNASYGYIKATPSSNSSLSRIEYANDSSTALVKGNLTNTVSVISQGAGNNSYGYLAGGFPTNSINNRIDYSNDTATAVAKGNMSVARHALGATGNSSYGYFGGGTPGSKSTVDRLDYSSDTTAMAPKGPLSTGRYAVQASGTPSYGYFGAGNTGDGNDGSTIVDRIDFSNDTATASVKGPLTAVRRYSMGVSSQGNGLLSTPTFIPRIRWVDSASETPAVPAGPAFAYIAGGKNPSSSHLSLIDRIEFANDTPTASPKGNLNTSRSSTGGTGNKSYGYFAGGSNVPTSTTLTIVDRIDYSSDTSTAAPKGPLTTATTYGVATGNLNFGYVHVGNGPAITKIERIDYSNDTANALRKGEIGYTAYAGSATGNPDFGYFSGGYPSNTYIHRVDYTNDTATTSPKGNLTFGRYGHAGSSNLNFGYFSGGSPGPTSKVDRIDYSNDTATASLKGPLSSSTNRTGLGGVGNAESGYVTGGNTLTIVDRIDYSNDTATASVKGSLSSARRYNAGTSALMLGFPQTTTAAIAAPVQPPFPYPEQLYNPATNKQHGYWACGVNRDPAPSTICFSSVDRLDFSNDTTAASPKGNATFAMSALVSVGNASYGYITGGYTDHPPSGRQSSINRLDYANDTADLTVTGSTPSDVNPEGIYLGWGVGNASYGYWGGNYPGSSRIFRLDYSNDTSAPIITGKYFNSSYADAAGNQSYGWIAGKSPSGSRVERLDYSNDSSNTVTKGPLTSNRYDGGAASNSSYGWFGGGKNGSPGFSTVDRIDFSNDTPTASPKGNLANAAALMAATGDPNYGYFGGSGPAFSAKSYIQRIEYANDTATASPKGPLSVPRSASTAFSAAANAMP